MIVYNTVKTEKPMSPLVLKIRGREGWILGGVAQSVGTFLVSANGSVTYPTIYHYHFWKKK